MASNMGVIARFRALLRTPYELLIVFGIRFKVRLWSFLYPKNFYKPLGPNQLRLITVHKAITSSPYELTRVSLHHETLENTEEYKKWEETADPNLRLQRKTMAWFKEAEARKTSGLRYVWGDYLALSYSWGSGIHSHEIILNDRIFPVTETLDSALRSLRTDKSSLRVWVDALCINQDDLAERGQEVRRMRNIYGDPVAVFVHLGPEAEDSAIAMQMIERMTTQLREGNDLAQRVLETAYAIQDGKEDSSQAAVIAIYKLLCRPYWSRMWIIQELALGDDQIIVACGRQGLALSDIRQMLKFMVLNQISFGVIIGHELLIELFDRYESAIKILWYTSRLRDLALAPVDRDFSFSEICHPILKLIQYASATDPRDKVYGAMSLMPAKLVARIDRQEKNYTLSTREVFSNFTKSIIEVTNDLDIIWNVNLAQETLSTLDLPSWSPDWTLRIGRSSATGSTQEWYFGADERYAALDKAYDLPSEWHCDPSRADNHRPPSYYFSNNDELLHCDGFEIGSINGITPEIQVANQFSPESNRIVQPDLVESPYSNDQEIREALIRTLLLDASGYFVKNSVIFHLPWFEDDDASVSVVKEMQEKGWDLRLFGSGFGLFQVFRQQIQDFVIGGRPFKEFFPQEVEAYAPKASFLEFSIAATNLLARRLVVTNSGHFGLAPVTVVPGDKIFIIVGSSMPVILRPRGKHYVVVGECYVDGFMKGEAMQALDKGIYTLRKLSLC